MLDGLPHFAQFVSNLVLGTGPRDSLAIVVFHHLGDLLNAARHAIAHYLPVQLNEPYLQNSSIGTPYQKWAKFTNDDFARLDECLRRLLVVVHAYYQRSYNPLGSTVRGNNKDAAHWFRTVANQYVSVRAAMDEPRLAVSAIHLTGWINPTSPVFENVWNVWPGDATPPAPDIVTARVIDIADRSALTALFPSVRANRDALAEIHDRLAAGLRAALTMEDVTASHKDTLSDLWMGVVTIAGTPSA